MRDLNISAAQGYRIERQTRDDRPARGGHLQAELIVPSRLAVVDDGGAERMFPYVVERRFADEHPRVAEYRERLHGVALELHFPQCGAPDFAGVMNLEGVARELEVGAILLPHRGEFFHAALELQHRLLRLSVSDVEIFYRVIVGCGVTLFPRAGARCRPHREIPKER